jgi:predicted AAA+ superfamily ATPase
VAAQRNDKIINYSKIARDVGVDDKSVKNYFTILEDTLLGFMLEPYHRSFRKRLKQAPKFYFIDVGVARALARMLSVMPVKSTSYYGELFEQFIIVECFKLASYFKREFKLSYIMTETGKEIDLIVERPGQKTLLIEIKSSDNVKDEDLRSIQSLAEDFGECEIVCLSCNPRKKKIGNVLVYPWQKGIEHFFVTENS